jgi:hypothetical protein
MPTVWPLPGAQVPSLRCCCLSSLTPLSMAWLTFTCSSAVSDETGNRGGAGRAGSSGGRGGSPGFGFGFGFGSGFDSSGSPNVLLLSALAACSGPVLPDLSPDRIRARPTPAPRKTTATATMIRNALLPALGATSSRSASVSMGAAVGAATTAVGGA